MSTCIGSFRRGLGGSDAVVVAQPGREGIEGLLLEVDERHLAGGTGAGAVPVSVRTRSTVNLARRRRSQPIRWDRPGGSHDKPRRLLWVANSHQGWWAMSCGRPAMRVSPLVLEPFHARRLSPLEGLLWELRQAAATAVVVRRQSALSLVLTSL